MTCSSDKRVDISGRFDWVVNEVNVSVNIRANRVKALAIKKGILEAGMNISMATLLTARLCQGLQNDVYAVLDMDGSFFFRTWTALRVRVLPVRRLLPKVWAFQRRAKCPPLISLLTR